MSADVAQSRRAMFIVMGAACLLLFLSFGTRATFGLFLPPVSADLGWGREVFALAIAVQNIVLGAAQPFVSAYADRKIADDLHRIKEVLHVFAKPVDIVEVSNLIAAA